MKRPSSVLLGALLSQFHLGLGGLKASGCKAGCLVLIVHTVLNAYSADFLAGADFSHLKFFEDRGVVYKQNGQPLDALAIIKSNGVNCASCLILKDAERVWERGFGTIRCLMEKRRREL